MENLTAYDLYIHKDDLKRVQDEVKFALENKIEVFYS